MSDQAATSVVEVATVDGIGYITLNRPESMNAITIELGEALERCLDRLAAEPDVHVIAIRGSGGNFCAGGDFKEVQRLQAGGPTALRPLFEHFRNACRKIAEVPQPVVALVEGVAMAGGFELIQACDLALVRDDARLCDNHINYGQVPGGGGSQRLPRLVGLNRALGHLLTGEQITGSQAVAWGLAYASFSETEFQGGVDRILTAMAARRPDALRSIKHLARSGLQGSLESGLDRELDAVVGHIAGEAGTAGVEQFGASPQQSVRQRGGTHE